jgi:ATP-binding cassette subfamily F protein uup
MALLSVQSLSMSYGGPKLLDGVSFTLEPGERVSLLGRNGEGKSTLMRILSGAESPDEGTLAFTSGARVAMLGQEVPRDMPGTTRDLVEHRLGPRAHETHTARKIDQLFSEMNLEDDLPFATLSGGQKRRALLLAALASEPDLLLLDEPTNHLDIESVEWLEAVLKRFTGAILFVTHDRGFLRGLATRILELDRGQLHDWDCGYETFLRRRGERYAAEEKHAALQDKKLAQEEAWIRQGIKARRTRNEGRVRALKKLREERKARRERTGTAVLQAGEADRSGQKVIEVTNLTHQWDKQPPLIRAFSTRILRGDKIGLIGPNGSGKTTLLHLLLGKTAPQSGTVEHGTRLEILYFDQHRFKLDESKTVFENVGEGSDTVEINGRSRHVISYLEDFLFAPERSRTPVHVLSGGERNRLLLAKLFTRPSNVLVMDEPTNDLDLETLELLETLLVQYTGTLLLVSHDREFLNNVVTGTLVFEENGHIREYPGGYDDWLDQRKNKTIERDASTAPSEPSATPKTPPKPKKRLTTWEENELRALPQKIETLEADVRAKTLALNEPDFYRQHEKQQARTRDELKKLAETLETCYARWEELESRA